jgi:hypothetical protein
VFYDFEQGYQPWVLDQGTWPFSTDFGSGIGLPTTSTKSTSYVYYRIAYIDITALGFTPKLIALFFKVGSYTASYNYSSRVLFLIRYYDSSGNLLREDTVASVSTTSTSMVYWSGGYVGLIPNNAARIDIVVANYNGSTTYASYITAWFDNVALAEDGSISIHATPVLFYNVTASYDIPINKSLSASAKAIFVRIYNYSPPPNTSVTPTLYYDSSTASPSTTAVLTVNSSVSKLNYSGSSNVNNEQQFSVDTFAIYIVQPPNTFIDLIVIWLNVNTSPQKPESVSFSIPSPASNYTTSYTASLKVQHSTTPALSAQASFSLSMSGDTANITYAKVEITVKDPSGNVVYNDYFEVQNGSVTKTPEALSILPNTTYSITYTVTVTASPTQQTVISVSVQYTTQPQVS